MIGPMTALETLRADGGSAVDERAARLAFARRAIAASLPEPRHMASPDAMIAAAAHVEREYGYGYRIGLAAIDWRGGGIFAVRASDGARFSLYADRYGNVERVA
jgi:hypothetical protein